jgi:hypothetical protein
MIDWLVVSKLLLNPAKYELIIHSSKKRAPNLVSVCFRISSVVVKYKVHVRDLGVLLDSTLTMEKHVLNACKTLYLRMSYMTSCQCPGFLMD